VKERSNLAAENRPWYSTTRKPARMLKERLLQLKEMKIKTLACNEN